MKYETKWDVGSIIALVIIGVFLLFITVGAAISPTDASIKADNPDAPYWHGVDQEERDDREWQRKNEEGAIPSDYYYED